jgi:hypothetical protein
MRVRTLGDPVVPEPARLGEDPDRCASCRSPDEHYVWVSDRWRVRAFDRPSGLPLVLALETRSHLDLGDLPNLLAAELGVMTVRLERAIRSVEGVAQVQVNRWADDSAHLHVWFFARPYGQLQLRGSFLSMWDEILPPVPESQWRENVAMVAAWLAEFGGRSYAAPSQIDWGALSSLDTSDAMTDLGVAEPSELAEPAAMYADEDVMIEPADATEPAAELPAPPAGSAPEAPEEARRRRL